MPGDLPVVVVGAGAGGLAAAFRLQQAGYRVRILEASEKVGGRLQSAERDGFLFDRAATIFPDVYENVFGICREAGLTDEIVPAGSVIGFAKPDKIYYLDSARLYTEAIRSKVLSWRSKLKMARMMLDNRRFEPLMSYDDLSIAAEYDTETAAEYGARRTTPEIGEYVIDATIRAVLGVHASEASVLEFFFGFNKIFGSKLLNFRGGMGSYPELLAARFDDIVLNAEVLAVEESADAVTVRWRDRAGVEHTEQAAGAVIATPGDLAGGLLPGLDTWRRDFLDSIEYGQIVTINVALAGPPKDIPAFVVQVPPSVDDEVMCIVLEHNKVPGRMPAGKGAFTTYVLSDAAERLTLLDDDAITKHLLAKTEKILGELPDVEWVRVNRWPRVVVKSYPGYYKKLGRFIEIGKANDKRIHIAGDFYSSSNANTATATGERAARNLMAVLAKPATVPAG